MGGSGSGWQGSKKTTVEESLTLSIKWLVQDGVIVSGEFRTGAQGWSCGGQGLVASFWYEANAVDPADTWFRIIAHVNGEPVDYRIRLVTTRPHFGELRWWFVCPRSGRRAAKLHLPPGGKYFAHREAYGLTYRSCQESGKFRSAFYRNLANRVGLSEAQLRAMLR